MGNTFVINDKKLHTFILEMGLINNSISALENVQSALEFFRILGIF